MIIAVLKEAEAGAKIGDLAHWRGVSVADAMLDNAGLKELLAKKLVTPA